MPTPRPACLALLALLCTLWSLPHARAQPCTPITGCEVPHLAPVDDLMFAFMCSRGIPGATLAVSRDGVVVYERGFGFSDQALTQPMPPDAMMRIASVSKPMTAAAIRVLIADGELSLSTHAFDLGQPGAGVLPHQPFPALGDPRLADITIDNLLRHRGGWDRGIAGDLTYMETAIAQAMGVPSPPGRDNTLRYILGQPLQHAPAAAERYSNIGYLVLGMIVEEISGMELIDFIHQRVLLPLGVPQTEHTAGRTFEADRHPREPRYHAQGLVTNVYAPQGPRVSPPYGGWDHEARVGQGGQITTTRALLALLNARYISGPLIGAPLPSQLSPGFRRNHTGALHGTESLARQRGDGICYAVIFNQRASPSYSGEIRTQLDQLFDSDVIQWPGAPQPSCHNPYDLNSDGVLNFFDIAFMIDAYQQGCDDCDNCPADLVPDCQINFFDVSALLQAFN